MEDEPTFRTPRPAIDPMNEIAIITAIEPDIITVFLELKSRIEKTKRVVLLINEQN